MLYFSWQSKTFNVTTSKGKTAGLTLDWHMGFALYDTESKTYSWKYKFSQLKGSSDDGKCKLKLHFQNTETKIIETKVSIQFGRRIVIILWLLLWNMMLEMNFKNTMGR